ncbi:unnamed protein product [Phytophthora fragariaefolia]|uniref:Unnamed protein product n=1 Tax=Phytophthora fragariaefolia TaxID=1490495 RepID=A0A9W6X463_9STRA|nr:unnamed protein product [Phytophthora fragariaefolia]
MKLKGNEGAAAALLQSAGAVAKGRGLLLEQQQTIFGLLGRWEQLEDALEGQRRRPSDAEGRDEEQLDTPHARVIARVRGLVQLGDVLAELFPECKEAAEVREELEKLREVETEAARLRKQLQAAREETLEVNEMLQQESGALEEASEEMERMRRKEEMRQQEDAALLEQQREACQAMEELVRESDQEIQKMTQSATACAEEMQSLRIEMESLAAERERLVRAHADEVNELQAQLASAMEALSAKDEERAGLNGELHTMQAQLDELNSEKEDLIKLHASEIEDLRQQLQTATESLPTDSVVEAAPNAEVVEALQLETATESVAEVAPNAEEVEALQLETATESLSTESVAEVAPNAEEVEALQLETTTESLSTESVVEAAPNAEEVEALQLETTTESLSTESVVEAAPNAEVVEALQAQNDNMVTSGGLEKIAELQSVIDNLQAQIAGYGERSQDQQDTISTLQHDREELQGQVVLLTNDKTQADKEVYEVQRAHEAEMLVMQTDLDTLRAHVADYEERDQAQQNTITSLEAEQTELQGRIEVLTNEKAEAVDALQNTDGEEMTRFAQRVADSEKVIDSLTSELSEVKNTLAQKLAEQSEAADAQERCAEEFRTCRSELDAKVRECEELWNDLEAVQDAEATKNKEAEKRASQLIAELRDLVAVLGGTDNIDAGVVRAITEKMSETPEVAELCNRLATLMEKLVSLREQHESMRIECQKHKQVLNEFVENADWRLFAKGDEDKKEVVRSLETIEDATECLVIARGNIVSWLDELQQLRDQIETDTVKFNNLKQEKVQEQECVVALEDSKRDLESLVKSLNEQLATMRQEKEEIETAAEKLKAQNHCVSVQGQQQQAAQQEEVAELQQQLSTLRSDFERYRVRSHTALKKMEKRAELLNGMRKENDTLLKQIEESNQQRDDADTARRESEARLQEVLRTQEMMQADFDQIVAEKARAVNDLEEEIQRLEMERDEAGKEIEALTFKIQELENEKAQIEEEGERIKEAEREAFQARLNTATAAVQTAKEDLQKVHDALETSKTENDKRQKRIEFLELELEQQQKRISSTTDTSNSFPSSPSPANPSLASPPVEVARSVAVLEKELVSLRASETSLRKQLDDAHAELVGLQERFATTKAANAEKVFALEEQSNHWKIELAAATEELHRLNSVLEMGKSTITQPALTNGKSSSPVPELQMQQKHTDHTAQMPGLSADVRELKTELADANTEITLLSRALDACREELKSARDQIDVLASSSLEPESGEDSSGSSGVSKVSSILVAKDEALKKLRVQVLELQEELQTLREEKGALELELEKEELNELQASRKHMQSEKERAMQLKRRQTLVSGFEKQVKTLVDELQQRLEDHSSAFREVCDFRDEHRAALFNNGDAINGGGNSAGHSSKTEFEECLVMRSGVVIKAGASFQLPVICEKRGWRVVWSFSVKEESADVSFKLSAMMADATSTEVEVVSPERMNDMSGVFQVQHDNTTLVFEWDNSFSWLNEKTLDYHVSIQEPLTPQAQKVRQGERELQAKAKLLEDGLALIEAEAQRRSELSATLNRLGECEAAKNKHLEEFGARKTEVLAQKTRFQEEMDAQKSAFSAMLREQDELEDVERTIMRAWDAAVAEREDVEMTLQLAGNGAQLETLAQEMKEQAESVTEQLKTPIRPEDEEESSATEEPNAEQDHVAGVDDAVEGESSSQQACVEPESNEKQE